MTELAIKFDQHKFAELMLYIAHKCRNDQRFGSVKLSKILFYCDFTALKRTLQPITGATYLKKDQGPFPAEFEETRQQLVADNKAEIKPVQVISHEEFRLVPTSGYIALSNRFTEAHRQIIDTVIEKMQPMNATEIRNYSHKEFGWKNTDKDEPIPYATAFIPRDDEPWVVKYKAERGV